MKHIPLDYISYDIYPYQFRERREWGFARFYDNARIVADACRDSGRAFWYIPQVNAFHPDDVTTANKMRYQAYAALACLVNLNQILLRNGFSLIAMYTNIRQKAL